MRPATDVSRTLPLTFPRPNGPVSAFGSYRFTAMLDIDKSGAKKK